MRDIPQIANCPYCAAQFDVGPYRKQIYNLQQHIINVHQDQAGVTEKLAEIKKRKRV